MLSLAASYKVLSPETDAELGARFLKSLEADGGISAAEDKALRGFQGGISVGFVSRDLFSVFSARHSIGKFADFRQPKSRFDECFPGSYYWIILYFLPRPNGTCSSTQCPPALRTCMETVAKQIIFDWCPYPVHNILC